MFRYLPIEEQITTPELCTYHTYGICVKDEAGNTVTVLSDISCDKQMVTDLAARCTRGELVPEQLIDVVLNSI